MGIFGLGILRLEAGEEFRAEEVIGGDATGEDERLCVGIKLARAGEFLEEIIDSGLLERGGEVGDLVGGEERMELVGGVGDGEAELGLDGAEDSGL